MRHGLLPRGFEPGRDQFPLAVRLGEPCLCGSGRTAIYCCWSSGRFLPRAVKRYRKPKGILLSNPGCYAAPLRDCSKKLSGEHWFSGSFLRAIAKGGRTIRVHGHPWQREDRQIVGIGDLKAKILCERHNEALSGLDDAVKRFAQALIEVERVLHDPNLGDDAHDVHLFRGDDIERWLLKVVIGAVVTGHAADVADTWRPPVDWLRYLFLDADLPPQRGFFFPQFPHQRRIVSPRSSVYLELSTGPKGDSNPLPRFAQFWLCGMDIAFITPYRGRVVVPGARAILHRPGEVRFVSGRRFVSFMFGWQSPGADSRRSTAVSITRVEDAPPASG
jgi:hypothetical protein